MSVSIFILLGSNLGDRLENLTYAQQEISRQVGQIITTSSIYKTAAWGNVQQPDFYNQVIEIHSVLSPEELLTHLLEIEKMAGRVRHEKWGARILDIDILFYGDLTMSDDRLTIPHPGIPDRKFTLLPMAEIAPHLIHPVFKKTIQQLLLECTDELEVEKLIV
jgi:2-amino-4-hydroxy-6-hydroxymethyldihydropteridine diphosphokinase